MSVRTVKIPIETISTDSIRSIVREYGKGYVTEKTRIFIRKEIKAAAAKFMADNEEKIKADIAHLISAEFELRKEEMIKKEVGNVMLKLQNKAKPKKKYHYGY